MTGPPMPLTEDGKIPPKPVTQGYYPERVFLPELTWRRRLARRGLHWVARALVRLGARCQARGLEHLPARGPALLTVNHLGDADAVVVFAHLPWYPEVLAAMELNEFPWVRRLLNLYGVIWVHRGRPDRKALRMALQALDEGRIVALAPEGRQSVTGALEEGTEGAAYLALKARVPVVPIGLTGTRNDQIFPAWRRLKRPRVTITVGPPLRLDDLPNRGPAFRRALAEGTERIMLAIARLLPPEYQGVYRDKVASGR